MVFLGIESPRVIFLQCGYILDGPTDPNRVLDHHNSHKHHYSFDFLGVPGYFLQHPANLQLYLLFGMQGRAPTKGEQVDKALGIEIF